MDDSASSSYPRNTLAQAKITAQGWRKLEKQFSVPFVELEDFGRLISDAEHLAEKAEVLRQERSKIVLERDRLLSLVWRHTKRIRHAAKAAFGDDSPDVQKLGIQPITARKRKARVEAFD